MQLQTQSILSSSNNNNQAQLGAASNYHTHQQSLQSPQQQKPAAAYYQSNAIPSSTRSPKAKGSPQTYNSTLLDREERDLINLANNLSKEEIWEKLEQKRFNQLKQAAVSLQSDMIFSNRCPKCTLQPPCKHYQTQEQILMEIPHFIQQPQFKQHLSPKRREILIKAVKDQSRFNHTTTLNEFNKDRASVPFNDTLQLQGFSQQNQNEQPNINTKFDTLNDGTASSQFGIDKNPIHQETQDLIKEYQQQEALALAAGNNQMALGNQQQNNNRVNRNAMMLNNTVGANPNGFRAYSEHQKSGGNIHQSKLSQYGANIFLTNTHQQNPRRIQQTQFLRKRQGNGGSPVPEGKAIGLDESKISSEGGNLAAGDSMFGGIGGQAQKVTHRDRTTVRIRTKNNQFLYGEASFTQPLNSAKHGLSKINGNNNNNSYMESSQQSLQEKERLQAVIAKYREEKIQRQIEKIEQERMRLDQDKQKLRDDEQRRKKYNETLKQKLVDYQQVRHQTQSERYELERQVYVQETQKQRQKRQYYEQQKKSISDYRQQKQKTDELLLIANPNNQSNQKMLFYNNFPSPQNLYMTNPTNRQQPQMKQNNNSNTFSEPMSSGGLITNAGQSYINSGTGQIGDSFGPKNGSANVVDGLSTQQQQQSNSSIMRLKYQQQQEEGQEEDEEGAYEQEYDEEDDRNQQNQQIESTEKNEHQ